jgi:hypothetical protein
MRTIDRVRRFTIQYLINTWLQPGAVRATGEKPFKRFSKVGMSVPARMRGANETLSGLGVS